MPYQRGSTRKVAAITEQLCRVRFSTSQVSTLASRLDTALTTWRERPLTAPSYSYVWVDARYEPVRVDGRVVSQVVLVVTGLRGDDGRREIRGVAVADTESEATYQELFRALKARGLSGVRLVISDDHAGLTQAITRPFQGAGWQHCQVQWVVRISPNRDACLRLVTALAMEQSDEGISGRRYLDVSLLTDAHHEPVTALAADA
jgi:transposase-like protein